MDGQGLIAVATPLFDHLVGRGEQLVGHGEVESFGGREIDHELEFGWLLDHEPNLFLIPSMKWKKPDGVLVDRDYAGEGQISPPEYGINVSKKGLKALEQFRFTDALVESIFGADDNKRGF
jgi:hypothetical protein